MPEGVWTETNIPDEGDFGSMASLELGRVRGDLEAFQSELMAEFYGDRKSVV